MIDFNYYPSPTFEMCEPCVDLFQDSLDFRLLMIEDHPVNQHLLYALLSEQGCKVDVASDGKKGLGLLKRNQYDLILLDLGLPDVNGLILIKALRKQKSPKAHYIPILVLTAQKK